VKRLLGLLILVTGTCRLYAAPASALAFAPDGAVLASGAHRQIQLRSLSGAKINERIPSELPRISSLSFSPNASWFAITGGTPGELGVAQIFAWNEKSLRSRFTNFSDLVTSAAFNRDATRIALASADASAIIFPLLSADAKSPLAPIHLRGHSGPVLDLAWSPDDDLLVTASADRSLKVWSPADGKLLRSFSHHTEVVNAVIFRPRGSSPDAAPVQCASASDDATVRIWQPKIGRMVRIIRGHDAPIFTLAYTPDGQKLFSAGKEGVIRRIDTESDQILAQWKAHDEPIYRITISPDGKHLASGDWAGNIHLWNISTPEFRRLW
jgi:WD40 repeat protein